MTAIAHYDMISSAIIAYPDGCYKARLLRLPLILVKAHPASCLHGLEIATCLSMVLGQT